jgi:hypothetical protein
MPAVVCGGVLVDLDEYDVLIACMLGDPVGIDEYFLPAHVVFLLMVYGSTAEVEVRMTRTGGLSEASASKSPEEVRPETTRTRLYIRRC